MLDRISTKLGDIIRDISGKSTITEKNVRDSVEQIKLALLEADVNLRVVRRFVNRTLEEASGEAVLRSVSPGQQFVKVVHEKLVGLLGGDTAELELKGPDTQSVVLLMGLQGSGKTTSAAKLGKRLAEQGRRPILVAADLVRPAAIEQLDVLAKQAGLDVYADYEAKNPVSVAKAALKRARKEGHDVLIVDTSGRLQVDQELMRELSDIKRVLDPAESLLVADAMTGQNAVEIAKAFQEQISLTGVVLTKFDSDTRGGAALSLKTVTGRPVKFIGTSEKLDGFEPFHPDRIASRILGMGDVVSFVERAQEQFDEAEAEHLRSKMATATMTLEDYLEQIRKVRGMGSMSSLMDMLPGMKGAVRDEDMEGKNLKREEAILLSMTRYERQNHRIVGPSRRKRVARGSGTSVYEVNRLLKNFDKMRQMMKKMSKNKKLQAQVMNRLGGQN